MFPEAEAYGRDAISLPMYPELTEDQQTFIATKLREAMRA
jgi:dTDP-4-amino-4,6-dideoxygalactose transaminase